MGNEVNDAFDIGDPFEFWAQQACKLSDKLGISAQFTDEALAIVKGAFGEAWLRKIIVDRNKGGFLIPMPKHPLAMRFLAPRESEIIEIYELAVYIKRLLRVKNIDKVLTAMKACYSPGRMQLAFGYRFLKLGATHMEFEPEAKGGRLGDIFFELDGNPFMVECYIPRGKKRKDSCKELQFSAHPIFNAIDSADKTLRVFIALKQTVGPKERKEIEKMVVNIAKRPLLNKTVQVENDFAKVTIDDIKDMKKDNDFFLPPEPFRLYGNADFGVRNQKVERNREAILAVREGTYKYQGIHSRILVKVPESERKEIPEQERIQNLTKKLKKKLPQTKTQGGNERRIVIAQIPEGRKAVGEKDDRSAHICREVQQRIVTEHSNVSVLFLCRRTWTTRMRYVYIGVIALGKPQDVLSESILHKLNDMEYNADWLSDWK